MKGSFLFDKVLHSRNKLQVKTKQSSGIDRKETVYFAQKCSLFTHSESQKQKELFESGH